MSTRPKSSKSLKVPSAPSIVKGWLRKKARSGLWKNWKTRFFVLGDGQISYYKNEISEYPFGHGLKVFSFFLFCFL
jgi:hypothetical protein